MVSIPFSIIFSKIGYEFPSSSFLLSANAISSFAPRRTSPVSLSIIDFASFLPSRNELSTTIVLISDFSISLICFTVTLLSLAIIKLPFLSLISKNSNINGVLTSGGERFAINAVETLKKMLVLVPDKFEIIIAGGITFENFESLHALSNGKFYHGKKIINIK